MKKLSYCKDSFNMKGKIQLLVNGKQNVEREFHSFKQSECLANDIKKLFVKSLKPNDTWEIALRIEADLEHAGYSKKKII